MDNRLVWSLFIRFQRQTIQLHNNILLVFEVLYIAFKALKGQLSHLNISASLYSMLYSLMGLAATTVIIYTAYVGLLFFYSILPQFGYSLCLDNSLRYSNFCNFSFVGSLMGSRMNHSVRALNDNSNWFIVGWSKTVGDLQILHFIGMHALQILPLLSFYFLKNRKATLITSSLYGLLAIFTLMQALQGKPILISKRSQNKIIT